MRKLLAFVAVGVCAVAVFAQGRGTDLIANFSKALNDAKTLNATYTVQPLGGVATQIKVELAKPNLAKIDTPKELIVADGTNVTVYNKKDKTYFKKPQNNAELMALFTSDETNLWAPFFKADAYKVTSAKNLGQKTRKGETLTAVEASLDAKGKKKTTLYLRGDNVVRQAEININDQGVNDTTILDAKDLVLGTNDANKDLFAFNAPDGSRELSWEEMNSARWFTNLDEAKDFASKTGKKIFVDFMATWCGPCKMLEREVFSTEQFKALGKYMVFCKIDVDQQPSVSQAYNVTAMPTQMVLNADGSVVATKVGYGGVHDFFAFINPHAK